MAGEVWLTQVPKAEPGVRACWLGKVFCGDGVGGDFGLPGDFDDVPLLAVVEGLDAVDAAVGGLVVAADFGFVGAPEVGDVGPGLGADVELMFVEHVGAALGNGVDPIFNGEDAGRGCAVGRDADGDQARVGKEECAEAGAVSVGGAGNGRVDGLDELVERGCGGAGGNGGHGGVRGLGAEHGRHKGGGEGEEEDGFAHGGILQAVNVHGLLFEGLGLWL
jgi:hypothetical protein